tara:strand:+ start:6903 stop:7139 length:237 start_codon:yes stop_codon:yes gene_type:complete
MKKKKLYKVIVIAEVSLTFDTFPASSKKEALDIIINKGCFHPDYPDKPPIDYYDMIIRKFIKKQSRVEEVERDKKKDK